MRRAGRRGGIVFVSSFFGFAPVPRMGNYAASKAYGLMLAEALAEELKETGVDVMALCPGVTRTELLETAGVKAGVTKQVGDFITMDAAEVVELGLHGLGKRTTVVTGWYNTLLVRSLRFLPRLLHARLAGLLTADLEKI